MPPDDRLIETKLLPPQAADTLVSRPRLDRVLERIEGARLIAVIAPAGYGKTTLLSAWLSRQRFDVAWLSLDPVDSSPRRFYRYLLAAAEGLRPGLDAESLLAEGAFDPTALLTALVNHLGALDRHALLILDDYHHLQDPALHEGVAFLLDHLPPRLHLALTSRSAPPLPLARLRVRRQLIEVGVEELRFTAAETGDFLTGTMGLALATDQVATLQARTEGWAASLQLAALSLRGGDPAAFEAAFERSDSYALDYLADEVFAHLPIDLQTFLLHTSVLERLNPELVRVVTDDPGAEALLQRAQDANLFLTPLDGVGGWTRYHALFADLLRRRLRAQRPELLPELHSRAAAWFDAAGYTDEAIAHVLAGGDLERAVLLVEAHSRAALWLRDDRSTVRRWLAALPDEVVRSRPRLSLDYAWIHFGKPAVEHRLEDVERQLGDRDDPEARSLRGEVALLRAEIAMTRGDMAASLARIGEADTHLSEGDVVLRSFATQARGYVLRLGGEVLAAETALLAAEELCRRSGSLTGELAAINDLAEVLKVQGRFRDAEAAFKRAIALGGEGPNGVSASACAAVTGLADLAYLRNDLEAALDLGRRGLELALRAGYDGVKGYAYLVLARTLQALGREDEARDRLREALLLGERLGDTRRRARIEADAVPLWLRWGDGAAERWARRQPDTPPSPTDHYERDRISLFRVQLASGGGAAVLPQLEALRARAEAAGRGSPTVELLLLEARAHQALERDERAYELLLQALTLAAPEGQARLFIDEGEALRPLLQGALARGGPAPFLRTLLAALEPPPEGGGTGDASGLLTDRELQILTLIAEGLSNQAIADRLIRSVGTVKAHSSSIYGKLGARNRTEAVARARDLGLI
jgi:LuxR family maltose regulon positive regulatory protein